MQLRLELRRLAAAALAAVVALALLGQCSASEHDHKVTSTADVMGLRAVCCPANSTQHARFSLTV